MLETCLETWRGAGWRLLPERDYTPPMHVALDEALVRRVGAGLRPPTLRFWGWERRAIVLGSFQSVRNETHEAAVEAEGVAIVRRISGGGAMFVEPERTITYSLYLPEAMVAGVSIADSYAVCDAWAVQTFRGLGIDCWYAPLNDIACAEGKIGGAAQARRGGAVLHHTTIAYAMEAEEMRRVLRTGLERISATGVVSADKQVSPLNRHTDLPRSEIVAELIRQFAARFGLEEDSLTEEERKTAECLRRDKYATEAWNYSLR